MNNDISVIVLGLRGFPHVQGGVETHAENLYPELARLGCKIRIVVRDTYQPVDNPETWKGVRFKRLWAPRTKSLEAIVHTFLGVIYAAYLRPDILHIHAIGPAFMTPLARLLGLRVVVTHHGQDYDRQKWGMAAKAMLRAGEYLGMKFASQRIVISNGIRKLVHSKFQRDSDLIPNGVTLPEKLMTSASLQCFGLTPGQYVLLVGRLVPEKRHLDLIKAFAIAGLVDWKLVIVGASDHPDSYVSAVLDSARSTPGVVCTGFQSGVALQELYTHAGLFVLPSSHEGLPIALLEALSHGVAALASAIPANMEICNPGLSFFPLGDIEKLAQSMREHAAPAGDQSRADHIQRQVIENYCWRNIAYDTRTVYARIINRPAYALLNSEP